MTRPAATAPPPPSGSAPIRLIALLTDFGLSDPYVGVLKGVLLGLAPGARVVDLTHGIPPQDVRAAAFHLMASADYFPDRTLFVCVVDPGVGSGRRILWARTARHQFLAPDNGLLSWALLRRPVLETRAVLNRRHFLPNPSPTFHGRDIFAPVAARLFNGLPPASLGPRSASPRRIEFPRVAWGRGRAEGRVLVVDRFGNAVTNLRPEDLPRRARISCGGADLGPLKTHYAAVGLGDPLALAGSSGFIELSARGGNFAGAFRVAPGAAVRVLADAAGSSRRIGLARSARAGSRAPWAAS